MNDIQCNQAGTLYFTDQNGVLRYQCQYCETWFIPKTRFKQKYCCESCRTMACRERKKGVAGSYLTKREATSNADIIKELQAIRRDSEEILQQNMTHAFEAILNRQHQTDLMMVQEVKKLKEEFNSRMEWLMLIAALAPVVSPAVISWFNQIIFDQKPPMDSILDQLSGLKESLDDETKATLKQKLKEKDLEDYAKLMGL